MVSDDTGALASRRVPLRDLGVFQSSGNLGIIDARARGIQCLE